MKIAKVDALIVEKARKLMREATSPTTLLVPYTDKNGNVVMGTPITADAIQRDPSLSDKITQANGGKTAVPQATQGQPAQTTTSPGYPVPVSGVAQPAPSYTNMNQNVNENYNRNIPSLGSSNAFSDTTLDFKTLVEFAKNPNNLYRNAAQRFLHELAWKKSAEAIVFMLKERGYLRETDAHESIESLHTLLIEKADSNFSGVIDNNKLAVVTGFNLDDGERKSYIVAEMWYTTDGVLRAINVRAYKDKAEKNAAYKSILG